MRKRWFYAIQLVLSLAIITALAAGCAVSPSTSAPGSVTAPSSKSTSTPPASEYPADISGRVTIAETVNAKYQSGSHAGETMGMTPLEGQIYWIVEISVENKSYQDAVTASGWKIVVNDKEYDAQRPFMGIQLVYPMTVPVGGTGETMIRFPVPDTLKVSDAKLCYQGEEPYSYGKLTGGDMVAVYDWDLKKAVPEELAKTTMTLQGWEFVLNKVTWDKSTLKINLTITNTMYRRQFGHPSDTAELAAIDSTGKMIKPWHPEPKTREEFLSAVFAGEPYQGEYYPNESKTVELKFEMHPLSGQTSLYYGQYYWTKSFKLFDVGAPE